MRVFVTGATGWVGSAVVRELIAAGHEVTGLSRSARGDESLGTNGASSIRGSLEDIDSLRNGVLAADGVIHTAFNHDWTRFAESCAADARAIAVMGEMLKGSNRRFLTTAGVALLAPGRIATEDDVAPPVSAVFPRASEAITTQLASQGVNAAAVRLAPSVHGLGDHGFVPRLAAIARAKGVSAYVGEGLNRWPAVHRLDAARVYRLALESHVEGPFHAVADEGVTLRDIAQIVGRRLNLPVASIHPNDAAEHFGWFAPFVGMDMPAASHRTRARLDWQPEQPVLLQDLDQSGYFDGQ